MKITPPAADCSTTHPLYVIDDRERGIFRVRRAAFTEPSVLEEERESVFDRCWLYAGHESEIREPGDFVTRRVGGRPLLLVRDAAGRPRALINSCSHRGNVVCREKSGKTRVFSCFYHAWSFDLEGRLVGLPSPEAYTDGFDRSRMGMKQVPRFEIYRGLMFVSFDPGIVDLVTYLADAREPLDHMLDYGGDEVEIVPGAQSYSMRANWKLLVENSMDGYHLMSTHQRYFRQYLPDAGMDNSAWMIGKDLNLGSRGVSLGNGHAMAEAPARPTPLHFSAPKEMAEIRARLDATFGTERAAQIADRNRNLFIFPNLFLISLWRTIRTFHPVEPGYTEIDSWAMLPVGEPQHLRQRRYENFISFLGPGGFGTPDDVSALEGCQRGFAAHRELPWSDISRGMGRTEPYSHDEQQMRAFWRRWQALRTDDATTSNYSDRSPVPAGAGRIAP